MEALIARETQRLRASLPEPCRYIRVRTTDVREALFLLRQRQKRYAYLRELEELQAYREDA